MAYDKTTVNLADVYGTTAGLAGSFAGTTGAFARQVASLGAQRDMQFNQLRQQKELAVMQIEADAQARKEQAEYGMKELAFRAGLQEQAARQEFDNQLELSRQRAKQQAEQFDYEYSAKNKQEMARLQDSIQLIKQSEDLTPFQKQQAIAGVYARIGDLPLSAIPSKKPPEGQNPGDLVEVGGVPHTRQADGSVRPVYSDWEKSPEGVEARRKHEQAIERIKSESAIATAAAKAETDLVASKAKLFIEMKGKPSAADAETPMYRSDDEIWGIIDQAYEGGPRRPAAPQQTARQWGQQYVTQVEVDKAMTDPVAYVKNAKRTGVYDEEALRQARAVLMQHGGR